MRGSLRSFLALLLLAPTSAWAAELDLGWDSRLAWDSNPLRSVDDEDPDFSVYVGPNLGIRDRGRALDYSLNYRMRYEQYIDLSSANGFEHFADGQATWYISPRSQLSIANGFSRTRGLARDFIEPIPGIDPVDAAGELRLRRNLVLRNSSTATYRYQLTQLWSFESSLIGQLYDYEDDLRSDVFSVRGSGQLMRSLSPRMAIGAGSAITRQNFSGSERSIEQGATIGELFGVFYYRVTPTMVLSLAGGPAWNQPDDPGDDAKAPRDAVAQDATGVARLIDPSRCVLPVDGTPAGTVSIRSCPTRDIPPFIQSALIPGAAVDPSKLRFDTVDVLGDVSDPDGSFTFFGRAALVKNWRTVDATLSYQRSASTSSGLGSTDLDVASAVLRWQPDRRRWSLQGRVTWTLQSSANELPVTETLLSPIGSTVWVDSAGRVHDSDPGGGATAVPNAARVVGVRTLGFTDSGFEIESLLFDLRATRRVNENLVVTAMAGWRRQESRSDFTDQPRDVDNFRFQVGFTWSLDPIEL